MKKTLIILMILSTASFNSFGANEEAIEVMPMVDNKLNTAIFTVRTLVKQKHETQEGEREGKREGKREGERRQEINYIKQNADEVSKSEIKDSLSDTSASEIRSSSSNARQIIETNIEIKEDNSALSGEYSNALLHTEHEMREGNREEIQSELDDATVDDITGENITEENTEGEGEDRRNARREYR